MTPEILLYIAGMALVPMLSWVIYTHIIHRDMHAKIDRLLEMHEHPENTGFGTIGLRKVLEENTAAIKALTHYIKYLEIKRTGEEPPPPIG